MSTVEQDAAEVPLWSCGCAEDGELVRMQMLMACGMSQRAASEAVWPRDAETTTRATNAAREYPNATDVTSGPIGTIQGGTA